MKKVQPIQPRQKFDPKKAYQSYADQMEDDLVSQGIVLFRPTEQGGSLNIDENYLSLPRDITSVVNFELGNYLNAFTQQKMYMRTVLNQVECYGDEAKKVYFESSKNHYTKLSSQSKLSETAKERQLVTDESIAPHYYEYMEWLRKADMVKSAIANIEDAIFLISREISRRTADWENENRNHNVGR